MFLFVYVFRFALVKYMPNHFSTSIYTANAWANFSQLSFLLNIEFTQTMTKFSSGTDEN